MPATNDEVAPEARQTRASPDLGDDERTSCKARSTYNRKRATDLFNWLCESSISIGSGDGNVYIVVFGTNGGTRVSGREGPGSGDRERRLREGPALSTGDACPLRGPNGFLMAPPSTDFFSVRRRAG